MLYALSVALHQNKIKEAKEAIVNTIVRGKNTTSPTDANYSKVINQCNRIAKGCVIKLRQSYRVVVQRLQHAQRYHLPKQYKA